MKVSIAFAVLVALLVISSLADARTKCEKRECRCKPGAISVAIVDEHGCNTCTCKAAPTTMKPTKASKKSKKATKAPKTTPKATKAPKTTPKATKAPKTKATKAPKIKATKAPKTTPKALKCPPAECNCKPGAKAVYGRDAKGCETCSCKQAPTKAPKTTPRKTTPRKTTPKYCPTRECRCKPGAVSVPVMKYGCKSCACKVTVLVSGSLVDDYGAAVYGHVVARGPITVKVPTDKKGAFELLLPAGDFALTFLNADLVGFDTDLPLSLTGYEKFKLLDSKQTVVPSIVAPTDTPTESPKEPVFDTVLIEGVLVDEDGKTAAGTVVVTDNEGLVVAKIPVSSNGMFVFSVNVGVYYVAFLNNGNVGFEGDYELIVTGYSGSQQIPADRSVVPKEGAVDPTDNVEVKGVLVDQDGNPSAGFVLVMQGDVEIALVTVGPSGVFSVLLAPGSYQITFANADGNAFVDPYELSVSGDEDGFVVIPGEATVVPGGDGPTDPTDSPVDPTDSPTDATTDSPAEPTEDPAETTDSPVSSGSGSGMDDYSGSGSGSGMSN